MTCVNDGKSSHNPQLHIDTLELKKISSDADLEKLVAAAAPERTEQNGATVSEKAYAPGECEPIEPPRRFFDGTLLFRCMDMLQIDREQLANNDPLLFRKLQGMCALCRSKHECSHDLDYRVATARWDRWWVYCPNAPLLTMMGVYAGRKHDPARSLAGGV